MKSLKSKIKKDFFFQCKTLTLVFVISIFLGCKNDSKENVSSDKEVSKANIAEDTSIESYPFDKNFKYLVKETNGDTVIQTLIHPVKTRHINQLKYNKNTNEIYESDSVFILTITKRKSKNLFEFYTLTQNVPGMDKELLLKSKIYNADSSMSEVHLEQFKVEQNKGLNIVSYSLSDSLLERSISLAMGVFYNDTINDTYALKFSMLGDLKDVKIIE